MSYQGRQIIVTGGTGALGSAVVGPRVVVRKLTVPHWGGVKFIKFTKEGIVYGRCLPELSEKFNASYRN